MPFSIREYLLADANLVAYYEMEDNSNDSKNTNHLTNTNVTFTTGVFGKAAIKDADADKLQINSDLGMTTSSDFTIHFWFRPTATGAANSWRMAILEIDNAKYYRCILNADNQVVFDNGTDSMAYTAGENFGTVNWHQFDGVKSGSNCYLYVDGVLRDSGSAQTGTAGSTVFSVFTQYNQTNPTRIAMDDLAVFNRALTTAEIANLYNGASPKIMFID